MPTWSHELRFVFIAFFFKCHCFIQWYLDPAVCIQLKLEIFGDEAPMSFFVLNIFMPIIIVSLSKQMKREAEVFQPPPSCTQINSLMVHECQKVTLAPYLTTIQTIVLFLINVVQLWNQFFSDVICNLLAWKVHKIVVCTSVKFLSCFRKICKEFWLNLLTKFNVNVWMRKTWLLKEIAVPAG